MNWYVIFVRTGKEHKVEQLLKEIMATEFTPFVPLIEKLFRSGGTVNREIKLLFPSYVFIKSELSCLEFIKSMSSIMYTHRDIVRVLRYGDSEIAMRDNEKKILFNLCNDEHCIEASKGIIVGDRVYVQEGPLKGWESKLKKVNRHKREAWIEIEFMGDIRIVRVALEIIKKIPVQGLLHIT